MSIGDYIRIVDGPDRGMTVQVVGVCGDSLTVESVGRPSEKYRHGYVPAGVGRGWRFQTWRNLAQNTGPRGPKGRA